MQRPRNDSDSGYYGYFLCLCQDKATMPSLLDEGGPLHFGRCHDIPLARSLPTLIGFCHGFCGGDFTWKPWCHYVFGLLCVGQPTPATNSLRDNYIYKEPKGGINETKQCISFRWVIEHSHFALSRARSRADRYRHCAESSESAARLR